ncbi:GIN domain-containing protein [Neolewinella persica]|uniref:GIN domain-containing protein n=1 Tax=Neolewinella persica TaxID=70998 RepID=UPI00037B47AD|nr:DUF2807 domain-containing protein [Neolewinella persica]
MTRFSFFLLAVALVCFTFSCESNERIVGSNNITTEIRDVSGFTGVEISSALNANITFGTEFNVTVRANDNVQDRVLVRRSGDMLEVKLASGNYREIDVTIDITMPALEEVEVSGASKVDVVGFVNIQDLSIDVSGASNLDFESATTVADLSAAISGASTASLFSLTATQADVNISGASSLSLTATDSISGSVTGASTLRYRGNPSITANTSGASNIVNAN